MTATFKACDKNNNGVLSQAEFPEFQQKAHLNYAARNGGAVDVSAFVDDWYAAYNGLTPGVEGVSLDDINKMGPIARVLIAEMMAA